MLSQNVNNSKIQDENITPISYIIFIEEIIFFDDFHVMLCFVMAMYSITRKISVCYLITYRILWKVMMEETDVRFKLKYTVWNAVHWI
jgi:hypothetical protein